MIRKVVCGVIAALSVGAAFANESENAGLGYIPYGNLQNASPEDIARAKALGESVAADLMKAYSSQSVKMEETTKQVKRRADDIANEAITAERDKVLDFLGVDPQSDTALYIFVSWSMPIEMLRSYAVEAMWAGGTLVFKGIPPGKDMGTFILKDLKDLVYGKGASANISIDPRLYDAYEIKAVPTVVFSRVRGNMSCQGVNPVPVATSIGTVSYDTCPTLDPNSYFKISGAVTTSYALQAFMDDGASDVQPYMAALSKGWASGNKPGKAQVPFTGRWDTVLSPADQMSAKGVANTVTTPAATKPTQP